MPSSVTFIPAVSRIDASVMPLVGTSNVQQSFPFDAFDCRFTIPCWPMPESFAPSTACISASAVPAPSSAAALTATATNVLLRCIDPPR